MIYFIKGLCGQAQARGPGSSAGFKARERARFSKEGFMKLKGPLNGTNPLLALISLSSLGGCLLLTSYFLRGESQNGSLWIVALVWFAWTPFCRSPGHALIFQKGSFAMEKNPPLKPRAELWFLLFYFPLLCFGGFLVFYTLTRGSPLRCAAAAALLALQILLMRRVWPLLRAAPGRGASAES